jgi:hypothetical protein
MKPTLKANPVCFLLWFWQRGDFLSLLSKGCPSVISEGRIWPKVSMSKRFSFSSACLIAEDFWTKVLA